MLNKTVTTEVIIRDIRNAYGSILRQLVYKDTGELLKEFYITETDKKMGRPDGGKKAHFIKLYKTNWLDIVMSKKLTPYEAGIFSMLLGFLDYQSPYIVHPQTNKNLNESEIADLIKVSRPQLHDTLQVLMNKGLIAKINKGNGRSSHFTINTNVVFNGNAIKDINDHTVFTKDCAYSPKVEMKYKQVQQK